VLDACARVQANGVAAAGGAAQRSCCMDWGHPLGRVRNTGERALQSLARDQDVELAVREPEPGPGWCHRGGNWFAWQLLPTMRTRNNSSTMQLEHGRLHVYSKEGGLRRGASFKQGQNSSCRCWKEKRLLWPWNGVLIAAVLFTFVSLLYVFYVMLSLRLEELSETGVVPVLKVPSSIAELKEIQHTLRTLAENHFSLVLSSYCTLYLFKQAFSVPGSAALNLAAGLLFGMSGWPLVSILSATGATLCYMVSWLAASEFVKGVSAESSGSVSKALFRMRERTLRINEEGSLTLFLYLTSARLFPGSPNWLLNLVLPHCHIPLHLFFFSILVGLLPYNFITVSAGNVIASVNSSADILDAALIAKLGFAALCLAGFAPALQRLKVRMGYKQADREDRPE